MRGVKVTSDRIDQFTLLNLINSGLSLPVAVLDAPTWSAMEIDNGDTAGIAALFPVDGMKVRHFEEIRLVNRERCVERCHLAKFYEAVVENGAAVYGRRG